MTTNEGHRAHHHDHEGKDGHDHGHAPCEHEHHRRGAACRHPGDEIVDLVQDVVGIVNAMGCGCSCRCGDHHECRDDEHDDDDGGTGRVPWRPGRTPGTSTGDLTGRPITPGDLHHRPPPRVWPGPRKDMWLPFLFMRANPGDTGTRPVVGPFWESPDIFILPGVAPPLAPPVPAQLGQVALAGQDNTVYAHVWNLGRGQAHEVVVEFYWCDPSLGFNPLGAHRIGTEVTWLGARGSGNSHRVVKCPVSWIPTFVNGGHECLLVRIWDVAADPMTTPEWDASINRHLGQRNIHVAAPGQAVAAARLGGPAGLGASRRLALSAGFGTADPLTFAVGPLYGHSAEITVERQAPTTMPWLQLHGGVRGQFPGQAVATGALTLASPGQLGTDAQMRVSGDGAQVVFASGDDPPPADQAHVYRVMASQRGQLVGGYTVVLLG